MRLLTIVSASFRGGATFSLLNLLQGLIKEGVEIFVITPEDGFLCEELVKRHIPYRIVPIRFDAFPPLSSAIDYPKFLPRLIKQQFINHLAISEIQKITSEWKPDIIHTNVSVINVGWKVARRLDIPHIWHIREYGDKDFDIHRFPYRKEAFRRISQESYSICITRDLADYFSVTDNGIVIYNGIEEPENRLTNTVKEKKFIYVGALTTNKGVTSLIKSFADFAKKDPDHTLELFGRISLSYQTSLLRLIDRLKMSQRIRIMGPTSEVFLQMQKAKAIIVPSRCEGFGRITAEAMLNHCLVIGRDTGGTKEQFDNGLNLCGHEIGIRFIDDKEISQSLLKAIQMSHEEYDMIVKGASNTVRSLYNTKKNVSETLCFLNKIKEAHENRTKNCR